MLSTGWGLSAADRPTGSPVWAGLLSLGPSIAVVVELLS